MKSVFSILVLLWFVCASAAPVKAGPYKIDLQTDPATPIVGRVKLLIALSDAAGKPITGATVFALAQMPGMPMGERESTAVPTEVPGRYVAPAVLAMAGEYDAHIRVDGALGPATADIRFETGKPISNSGGSSVVIPVIVLVGLAMGGIWLLRRMRATGQRTDMRGILSAQVIGPLFLLALALAGAIWAVNKMRRPGSMTPLEAQIMDMNAPAPEGAMPVELVTVQRKPFVQTVTYVGQAVGFVEQDVVARVSGAITAMPVYVGDHVTRGQVLAKLDTSQVDPMLQEKEAQSAAASQGVGIAESDYRRALADLGQAKAEEAIRQGAIDEAKAMLTASRQERAGADANLKMEQANVEDARSQVTAAEADRTYANQELSRAHQLFESGAISRDEFQKSQAEATSANAKVRQANAGVQASLARVLAARSGIAKAAAGILAAENRLREIQAEHHSHMAHVASAQAMAESAKRRIGQASSEHRMAQAGLEGVRVQKNYSELRAEVDGVVTARLLAPGVLASPGQALLKIAQVAPIRLQANVPASDLAKIHLGSKAVVRKASESNGSIEAVVTSIAPSVDPSSRLGTVEILYPNKDRHFSPGEALSVEINLGQVVDSDVIPSSSVETRESRRYVWVAEPLVAGTYSISRHEIQVSGQQASMVAVSSGIKAGQKVVVSPSSSLMEGMSVKSVVSEDAPSSADQTVEITAAGYDPPSIYVPVGRAFKVTFIRRDDKTCGTEVIFPDLGIQRKLPLNQKVTIEIPPQPAGKELHFTCPMNMLNGKAVVR